MMLEKFKSENDKLYDLFTEEITEKEKGRYVCYDGAIDAKKYLESKIKIVWLLKEPYDGVDGTGGGWRFSDLLPEKELYKNFKKLAQQTWHPITYVSHSILNDFMEYDGMPFIRDEQSLCESLREIAIVNVQKLPSKKGTRTDFADIEYSFEKYKHLLEKQLNLLNPDVFIGGNTMWLYKKLFDLKNSDAITNGSIQYWETEKQLFIDAYHPAQTQVKRKIYVNDIINTVKKWSGKNQKNIKIPKE